MNLDFSVLRVLRTPHSERFILAAGGKDFAALELHYLTGNKVDGTLIVFDEAMVPEDQVPAILEKIDDQLLPDVAVADLNLTFTVVYGRVLGAFQSSGERA